MPELPDLTIYVEALSARLCGERIEAVEIHSPFVLRTVEPPPPAFVGRTIASVRRLGKRIAIGVSGDQWLVIHLMIAGRLHWFPAGRPARGRPLLTLAVPCGRLTLTEAGTTRRAALHLIGNAADLAAFDAGGMELLDEDAGAFRRALGRERHTLKRFLTDPRLVSGVGNAYSDEILHRARLSPVQLTDRLGDEAIERLYHAAREVLGEWTARLRAEAGDVFPEGVTAFRAEMAVHGRYGKPCPVCQAPIQRIRYAERETDYCPRCQTEGRLLADRSLSRLLRDDWPRTLDALEAIRQR